MRCSVLGCHGKVWARGLCKSHYKQKLRSSGRHWPTLAEEDHIRSLLEKERGETHEQHGSIDG